MRNECLVVGQIDAPWPPGLRLPGEDCGAEYQRAQNAALHAPALPGEKTNEMCLRR